MISWGGTMSEYHARLMMKSLDGTLVSEACRTAVARQVEYGRQAGVPWGISESAFGAKNQDDDTQASSPRPGSEAAGRRDLVIASMPRSGHDIRPRDALENFPPSRRGRAGPYGFYEAIDYTPDRLPGRSRA